MKRILISLLFLGIVFSAAISSPAIVAAETDTSGTGALTGTLIINGIEINDGDPVLTGFMGQLTFPLRTILEAIGSTVIFESSTGDIFFDFDGVVYASFGIFEMDRTSNELDFRQVGIRNVHHISDMRLISPFAVANPIIFRVENDRIYLPEGSGVSLFRGLGFEVEIDREQRILSLFHDSVTMDSPEIATAEIIDIDAGEIGTLFVNGIEITEGDPVIVRRGRLYFPFRTILESLGSTVIFESSTGNYYFDFDGVVYVLRAANFPPTHPDFNYLDIFISNVKNINCGRDDELIRLMGGNGFAVSINGRTYLNQRTGQRLFEVLGFDVEIESVHGTAQGTLKISGKS